MAAIATRTLDGGASTLGDDSNSAGDAVPPFRHRVLSSLEQDGLLLSRLPAEVRGDSEAVRVASRQNVTSLANASKNLRGDKAFMVDLVSRNGRALQFPALVFPFRRALLWVEKTAYNNAMASPSSHNCAFASFPSPETWAEMFEAVKTASEGFEGSGYYEYTNGLSSVDDAGDGDTLDDSSS